MYILKLLAFICAAAYLGAGSLSAQTYDADAQNKAREALRQKLADLDATNAPTVVPPVVPVTPQAPEVQVTPVAAPEVQVPVAAQVAQTPVAPAADVTIPTAPASLSNDQESQLREAMRQAITNSRNNQPVVVTPPSTISTQPVVPAVAPAAPVDSIVIAPAAPTAPAAPNVNYTTPSTPIVSSGTFTVPVASTPTGQLSADEQDKVMQAMRQQKAALDAKDAQYPVATTTPKKGPGNVAYGAQNPYMENATPPPAALIPGSKEQKLYDLLQLYKQDRITPSEYHDQRAKIITGP